jgi:hypothetical protein
MHIGSSIAQDHDFDYLAKLLEDCTGARGMHEHHCAGQKAGTAGYCTGMSGDGTRATFADAILLERLWDLADE